MATPKIRPKGGTAAALASANPFLVQRELVVEHDTGRSKIGPSGGGYWNALPYADAAALAQVAAAYVTLAAAAKNPDLIITGAITRNGSDVITSAAVAWPDGTAGTFTTDVIDSSGAINGYHITYGSPPTRTFTQPTMTRNANGAVTALPAIVVS